MIVCKKKHRKLGTDAGNTIDLASIGDAELVNANVTDVNATDVNESSGEIADAVSDTENNVLETNSGDVKTEEQGNDYFVTSKLERNIMYSQMIDSYQKIIDSSSAITEQKTVAQEEINKINELQNAIMIAENLLSTKGFENNIIFVNGDSISVIIGKAELSQDEIAQIQNIISRELNAEVENIHISKK